MTAAPHTTPADPTPADSADVRPMRVEHRGGDKFDITVRGHVVRIDQPVRDRGEDAVPTPTELFTASLAACVAFNARSLSRPVQPAHRRTGRRDDIRDGCQTRPGWSGSMRPIVPEGVPAERLDALLAVASDCTVHNTL